uniref:Hsp90 chaperone protein kinase-targeting subunit n=1 Tax=Ditylum brightwellii TaxID=49249 RepID=A0A6U3R563_9STRA|mmetsp:Transcript_23383/g.34899  ORF Transcript_23383/g.34899 Transcript_23383/m.34899 type:complete len:442 (+) Transcript_23383:115-1440(+)
MSKPFDYSKWDNIELSDDEDDVHPNIDRESWFRMKHRSRVEREEREDADKKKICLEVAAAELRMKEITKILSQVSTKDNGDDSDSDSDDDDLEDTEGLKAEKAELEKANKARQAKLDEYEKNKKWNVDNICHVVEERTIVNPKAAESKFTPTGYAVPDEDVVVETEKTVEKKEETEKVASAAAKPKKETIAPTAKKPAAPKKQTVAPPPKAITKPAGPETESNVMMSYHDFTLKYADLVEKFMSIQSLDKSKEFLLLHGDILLQENASNYLLLASLEDEMNGFHDKMKLTARQSQIISNIAELAKSLKSHPGNVVLPFFKRLEQKEFLDGFNDGVNTFVERIEKRAVVKKKEMDAEREAEAKAAAEAEGQEVDLANVPKEERMGPGGLDPVEVFESLPQSMQEAFESREVDKLKEALMAMNPEEAEYHMKRCVDSGLWNEG